MAVEEAAAAVEAVLETYCTRQPAPIALTCLLHRDRHAIEQVANHLQHHYSTFNTSPSFICFETANQKFQFLKTDTERHESIYTPAFVVEVAA